MSLFEASGAEFEIYDRLRDVPPYDKHCDTEETPQALRESARCARSSAQPARG